jgi:hypothetical protein
VNYKFRPEGRSPAEEQSVARDQVQSLCIMPENKKSLRKWRFQKYLTEIHYFIISYVTYNACQGKCTKYGDDQDFNSP